MNRGFLKRRIGTWINSLENKVCAPNDSEQKQDVGKSEIVSGSSTNNDENSSGTAAVTETIRKPCVSKLRSRFPKPKPNVKPSERKSTSSACVDKEKGVSIQSDKKDQKDEVPEVETLTSSSNTVVSISACTNSAGDVNKENDRTEAANPRSGWNSCEPLTSSSNTVVSISACTNSAGDVNKENDRTEAANPRSGWNSCEQELGTRTPKEDENITCNEKEWDETNAVIPSTAFDALDSAEKCEKISKGANQPTPVPEPSVTIRSHFPKCKPNLKIPQRKSSISRSKDKEEERPYIQEHNDSDVDQTKIVTPNMPVDGPDGRTSGGTNQTTPLLEPVLPIRSRFPKCKPNLGISKRQFPSSSLSEDKGKERLDIQCAKECGDNIVDQSKAAVSNMPVDKLDHRISGSTSETNPAKPTNTTEGTNQQNPLPQPVIRSRFPRLKPNLKKSERKSGATPDIHCVKQQDISKNDVNDVQVEVVVLEDSSDVTDTTVDSTEDSVGALRIDSIACLPRVGSMIVPAALVNKEQVSEYGDEKLDSKTYLSKESQDHIQSKENREQNTNTHIHKRDGSASMESEASPGTSVSTKEGESSLGTTKCGKPEKKQSPIRRRSAFLRPKPNFRKCSSKMKADILKDTVDKQADVQTDRQHDVKNDQVKAVVPDDSASTVDLTARSSNDSELARFASEMRQLIRESLPCLEPVSTNCDRNLGFGISKATEVVPTQSDKEWIMSKKDNSTGECEASAGASMSAKHGEHSSDTTKCEEPPKEPSSTRMRSRFGRPKPNFRKFSSKLNTNRSEDSVVKQGRVQNVRQHDGKTDQDEVVIVEDSSDTYIVDSAERSSYDRHQADLESKMAPIIRPCLPHSKQVSTTSDRKLMTGTSNESEEVHIQSDKEHDKDKNDEISVEHLSLAADVVVSAEGESSGGAKKHVVQQPGLVRIRPRLQRPKPNLKISDTKEKTKNVSKDSIGQQANVCNDGQHDVKNDQVKAVVPDDSASTVDLTARSSNDSELAQFASEMRQLIRESLPCLEPVSTNCDRNLGFGISKATEVVPTQSDKEQSMSKKDNSSGECEASADASMSAMHRESPSDTTKCEEPQKEPRNTRMRSRFGRPKPNFRKCSSVLNTNHSEDSVVIRGGVQNDSSSGKKLASKNDIPDSDGLKSHLENESLSGVNSHEKKVDSKDITKEVPEKSPDDELTSRVNCSNLDSSHTQNLVEAKARTDKISAIDSDVSDDTILSAEDESSTRTAKSPDSQQKLGPVKIRPHLPKPKPNLKRISTTKKSSTSASKASSENQGNICNDRQKSSRKESRSDSTDSDAVSPLKERNDSSSLSEVQSHKRKCVTKNNKECPEKRKARHKIHDQKAMTMLDLIYWNPRENPMVPPSSDKAQDSIEVDSPAADSAEGNADCSAEKQAEATKDREKDASANPVHGPQVIIGTNGEITIDESSLVVHRPVDTENLNTVTVSEDGSTTYSSFRTKPNARIWDDKETKKFYKALSTVGTDFTLMSELFTNRSRRELKLKYKREERYNRSLVDHALDSPPIYNLEMFRHDGDGKVGDTNKEGNAEKPKKTRKRRRKATGDQNVDVDSDVHQSPPKKKKRSQRRSRKKFLVSSSDEDTLPVELVPQNELGESEKTNSYVSADECQNEKDDGVGSTIIELIVCDDDIESARSSSKLIQDETTLLDEKQQILSKSTSETHHESEKIMADKCEQSDLDASQNCVTETAQELIPQESLSEEKTVLLQKCLLTSNKSEDSLIAYAGNAMDDVASLPPVEVVETGVNKSVPSTKRQCPTELDKNLSDILLSPFVSESSSQEVPNPHKFLFLPRQGPSNEQVIHVFLVKDKDVSQQGKADNSSCEKRNTCDAGKTDENNPNKGFINVANESECCVTQCKSDIAHSSLNCSEDFTNQNAMP